MNESVTVKYKHKRLQRSPDNQPLLLAFLLSAHPKEEGSPHHGHVSLAALTLRQPVLYSNTRATLIN